MAGTRTSSRQAAKANGSSPPEKTSTKANAGSKRKADSVAGSSPTTKRGRKESKKEQKTIEETLLQEGEDVDMKEDVEPAEDKPQSNGLHEEKNGEKTVEKPAETKGDTAEEHKGDAEKGADAEQPADEEAGIEQAKEEAAKDLDVAAASEEKNEDKTTSADNKADGASAPATKDEGAIESDEKKQLPSTILEKGIIYFFTRGRVGIEDPKSVTDLQRSFFVMRPLPGDAKLGDGAIQDLENNRLIAIPKKVLPKGHQDRFMVFVEKGKTTIKDLKENFMEGSTYETQTSGVRSTPPVTLIGEGVYALTTEARNTHLAYMLTIPSELGEIQQDMGIRSKGSFLISLKNPTVKGPANATLPQGPEFPKEVIDEFRGRSWMPPSDAKQLDYPNAQFLLIGEGEEGFDKAIETSADGNGKDGEAKEEIEELEHQDEIRVEHLHGDHTVFDDLDVSKKDYSLATTW